MDEKGITEPPRRATVRCPFCAKLNRVDMPRAGHGPRCGECGRPILLDRPIRVAAEDFDRLVGEAQVPVLVDFYADWCGPCKAMAPVLDGIARDRTGELLVAKLDTDRSPEIARRFGIASIPTLVLFRHGEEAERITGAVPRARLESLLAAG